MKIEHHVYCRECGESILKQWKGWPHRDVIPMLPRIFDKTCEVCGGAEGLEPSNISWLNYHSDSSTGLPDYWLLVIASRQNKWGQPYFCESNCSRCNGRSIVSQMNYPNGTMETCHNCNECGTTTIRDTVAKILDADGLPLNADARQQKSDVRIEAIFKELQWKMAQTDLIADPRSTSNSDFIEFLLVKRKNIKIKIYQERGHAMPHVHIDYKREHHVASFSIETAHRIEGSLSPKYDGDINAWISKNKEKLLEVWSDMQSGGDPQNLIAELHGDA